MGKLSKGFGQCYGCKMRVIKIKFNIARYLSIVFQFIHEFYIYLGIENIETVHQYVQGEPIIFVTILGWCITKTPTV